MDGTKQAWRRRWPSTLAVCLLAAIGVLVQAAPGDVARDAATLADERHEGRLPGSPGERAAAQWLSGQLAAVGATPLPGRESMLLPVQATDDAGNDVQAWNVVAWLGPTAPDPVTRGPGRVVVLCAHHDHLGRGQTPRSHARPGERGQVHPGADDNASGVAVVLAVARELAASPQRRGVVVAFFTAEELGGQGARAFLDETLTDPAAILAAVNVDMVGRLGDGELLWNGGVHVAEWSGLLAASASPVPLSEEPAPFGANDAEALRAAGIPVLDLTTALHEDYHRPTDTADKLDAAGLDRVAELVHAVAGRLVAADAPPFAP